MYSKAKKIGIWMGLMLWATAAMALKSDPQQPINIEADSADLDEKTRTVTYQGNVVVRQGSILLKAEKVVLEQSTDDKTGDRFSAFGHPATFRQQMEEGKAKWVKGEARELRYNTKSELLELIGNAWVDRGGDVVRSDRLTYDRAKAQIRGGAAAKGKKRVRIIMQPKNENP
jgi:lipopolysaccharide export system protein LptA